MTQKNPEMDKLLSNAARDISGAFAARFCALGIELGLFKAIAETDGLTSAELSQVTGFNERYVREWVYGVSLAGYLEFDQQSRKASMTDEQKLLLVTEGNRFAQYGAFQVANSALLPYAELKDVFRNGGGLEFTTYPVELWRGLDHTGCTRYRNFLVEDWLPHLIEVPKKLRSGGTFADFGCGTGRSTIELAKLFPDAKFYGFDAFDKNIDMANENVEEAGGLSNIEFK
ncbi:MAG: methyltransferase domain-containing protein, partial [Rhodobacterales bacterium]|nr:methyltransferase domain-containing protein [Rhodobacterales bacterium]